MKDHRQTAYVMHLSMPREVTYGVGTVGGGSGAQYATRYGEGVRHVMAVTKPSGSSRSENDSSVYCTDTLEVIIGGYP